MSFFFLFSTWITLGQTGINFVLKERLKVVLLNIFRGCKARQLL